MKDRERQRKLLLNNATKLKSIKSANEASTKQINQNQLSNSSYHPIKVK